MPKKFEVSSRAGRGAALVVVFLVMAVLASTIIALLQVTVSNAAITDNTRDRYQALLLAQAGMNQAIDEMNLGKAINGTHQVGAPYATWGTQQNYVVTNVLNADGTNTLTSIGTFNYEQTAGNILIAQRKLVAVVARPVSQGKFFAGGFGKSSVTLTGVAQTDSFNSANGTYAAQMASTPATTIGGVTYPAGSKLAYDASLGNGGNVASNGPISGVGNIIVHGAATPGPGNVVSLSGGATVTGSTAASPAPFNVPSYVYSPPAGLTATSYSGNTNATITTGTYLYSGVKQTGGTITFSGGGVINMYLAGDWKQSGQGLITVASGTTVNIYQASGATFDLSGQGLTNSNNIPSTFNVVSASTSNINVTGQGDIYATVYAPDASVKVAGQGQMYGAVIGNDLTLDGLGEFHYDQNATSPGIQTKVVVISYWEVDM
ncbi:MAG TPA: hypothetical protein VKV04_02500 [Verrucomicrobiae bacterium]|nr:hypothetical protein [Verrucomicrobiae bacterium]